MYIEDLNYEGVWTIRIIEVLLRNKETHNMCFLVSPKNFNDSDYDKSETKQILQSLENSMPLIKCSSTNVTLSVPLAASYFKFVLILDLNVRKRRRFCCRAQGPELQCLLKVKEG